MTGQWKPGDVASFLIRDKRVNAIRTSEGRWTAYAPGVDQSWLDRPWDGMHGQRPLVVIDPEDREQARRLIALFWANGNENCDDTRAMTDALREFANPTPPKPEEPTGLGAVVRDSNDRRFTRSRSHDHGLNWREEWGGRWTNWLDLDAVEVLSEGVTP